MADPWYSGAERNPGINAGYRAGRSTMRAVIAHFTVGVDSTAIGLRGYFHWLVSRDGRLQQFAEADALTWHAGEANNVGPGIEVEYYTPNDGDEVFTPVARATCSGLVAWLNTEWGIPDEYYDGARIDPSRMRGFVSHRSVLQREGHSDYWPQEDWDAMVAPAPVPTPTKASLTVDYLLANTDDGSYTLCTALGETPGIDGGYALALIAGGMPVVKLEGVGRNNLLLIRASHRQ